jgi:hypothetical protein
MNPKATANEQNLTAKSREITLTVKTSNLFNLPYPPTKAQIEANTYLIDDEGLESRFGESNKDFETLVYMGKDIVWNIRSFEPFGVDNGYLAALESVSHNPDRGNPNFFEHDPLLVGQNGSVCGVIATNPNWPNKDDSYTINFLILHEGKAPKFPLDPKLRINTFER